MTVIPRRNRQVRRFKSEAPGAVRSPQMYNRNREMLREFERGVRYAELADRFGLSRSGVSNALARARRERRRQETRDA